MIIDETDYNKLMNTRTEQDTMGSIEVPSEKLWGAQTQRSIQNFPIGPAASMPIEIMHAFGYLKKAAALTNADLGVLPKAIAQKISSACDDIIAGELDDHFPLVIWQTGSGTQSNMNCNEVIANRCHLKEGKKTW
jgi:fumarate hydratase class II